MSQIENIKYDKAPAYTSDTDDDDRYKDIIMKSKYSKEKDFNVDDYEVYTEEEIEQKARDSIENYVERWWEDLTHNWRHEAIMSFVEINIEKYIDWCIDIDGIEHHAGLEDCNLVVEYEGEIYYVINRGDIPW